MIVSKELLEEALNALVLHNTKLKRLGESGDAGFWNGEDQKEYIVAKKVIDKLKKVLDNPEVVNSPLTDEQIKRIDDQTHFHESFDWNIRFAKAIERWHGIGVDNES